MSVSLQTGNLICKLWLNTKHIDPMRYLTPDSSQAPGESPGTLPVATIPTGMETDPHADEEVISKSNAEDYPEPVQAEGESAKIAPDDLADSIAYALDGSGPGPTNA